jgi:outer membrane protein
MKKIAAGLFLAAGLPGLFAQTNNPAARPLSLTDCFTEALKHNLDVQIEQTAPEISLYNLKGAYSGYDPLFSFSGQHLYNDSGAAIQNGLPVAGSDYNEQLYSSGFSGGTPWGMTYDLAGNVSRTTGRNIESGINGSGNPVYAYVPFQNSAGQIGALTLTQPLLKNFWIDSTRLSIRINKNRLQYNEQGVRWQIIKSVTDVEKAYYELIYARENVKVQRDALVLAQTQMDQDKQRVKIGSVAERDGTIEQDESQVAQSRANLIAAESTLGTDQRVLKNLITDEYPKWFDADIQPTLTLEAPLQLFDLQDSWSKGMTQRPDLVQTRLDVEQQGIRLKYYRNQLFPEVDLIGTYGYNGSGQQFRDTFNQFSDANRPFYSYGAQLSIPLGNIGPRNQLKSGKMTEKQLLLTLKQLEQNIMVEIDNAVGVARSDYEAVDASRQTRIYAEAALNAEQKKYEVGKSTTFTVLQLQNKLTLARSQEIRDLANYNQALADLAKAEGSTLQRDKIDLDAK